MTNLTSVKVSSVEFNYDVSPRVIVTVGTGAKYGIHWEDKVDEDKYMDYSLVIYNILLSAMANQELRISGTFVAAQSSSIDGMIKTLKIQKQ
ncbi:hypothetical protein [Photorhabdus khanii]|uniref:Uncharacterized protein n=1 Tax=Photorhabdus khanii subsp. guanajuatensis TaxID=2100166 RepID=A0A4R4K585_9GAMM|nr:hypothetical protein [Photorhabdus khanii]TDB62617.1 hypothetical protein C5467_02505 [Photorhabdus khanii subsp. guanajuatensis]